MSIVITRAPDPSFWYLTDSAGPVGTVKGAILIDPTTGAPITGEGGLSTSHTLLNAETAVVTGPDTLVPGAGPRGYTVKLEGTGAITATVYVDVSGDGIDWILARYTFTLSGTTLVIDWFTANEAWPHVRGRIGARTGTGAAVTLKVAA